MLSAVVCTGRVVLGSIFFGLFEGRQGAFRAFCRDICTFGFVVNSITFNVIALLLYEYRTRYIS